MGWFGDLMGRLLPPPMHDGSVSFSPTVGPARTELDNFTTNRVSLQEHDDARSSGSALGLSATWACVNLLAGTIGSLPLMVYRTAPDGSRTVARDHPLYRLLHDSPNADQTAVDFLEFAQASVELHGNAYAEKLTVGSRLVALAPIRPDLVTARRLGDGDIEYSWSEGGRGRTARSAGMLHIRGFGGGMLGGASTLAVCRSIFQGARAADATARNTFTNGAWQGGVLTAPKDVTFTGEQRSEVETLLQEKFVGAKNAGRPMLLDKGLTWTPLTINPDDAQLLESRKFSGEEICRIFGVPPAMVGFGDKSSNWGTGKEVDVLGFLKFSLRRRCKRIEQALEKQLLTAADRAQGIIIEFNLEGLLRGDSEARAKFYQAALGDTQKPGWMVRNEVRKLENLPPMDGWDQPIEMVTEAIGAAVAAVEEDV